MLLVPAWTGGEGAAFPLPFPSPPAPRMSDATYLSAEEAANALDVTKSTLYAYVSRGLIRSEPVGKGKRAHRYPLEDVQRLRRRRADRGSGRSPQVGEVPVLPSSLTLADETGLFYRGHDATHLALIDEPEAVAALLWRTSSSPSRDEALPPDVPVLAPLLTSLAPVRRMQALLPIAEADDPRAYDLSPGGAARTGWRILRVLTHAVVADASLTSPAEAPVPPSAARPSVLDRSDDAPDPSARPPSILDALEVAWNLTPPIARRIARAAVVLCVDHGLGVTAYAARCAASAGATPYGAVQAGLTALLGRRHAGGPERVDALFREADTPDRLAATIAQRLRRGDAVPGFGHPTHPDGDPRAAVLLDLLEAHYADAAGTAFAVEARTVGPDLLDAAPSLPLALVAVARVLDLPAHAPLTLFALGRSVGWVGHAIEQYEADTPIRPRAKYVGPTPK